ncbi:MAG: yehU 2, partial [Gemmatimonadetes bacterium]|nr:yehU 2 [Gemmatimonadota bacterium]
ARAERALRALRLEAGLARTQLEALRSQVQPHFLFNTLHAVSALMATDVAAARRMITDLGDLLRLSLDAGGAQEVPLREELGFLEQYVAIQRARFRDRLDVGYQVDADARDAPVPRLLLQPLVENALSHGLAPRSAAGRVDVRAWLQDGSLRLAISDDGVGLGPGPAPAEGHGLGDTRERLRQLYGDRQALEMTANPGGGVTVQVTIPLPA